MPEPYFSPNVLLYVKCDVAIRACERLLRACSGHEAAEWLIRYADVLDYLRRGELQLAITAECSLYYKSVEKYSWSTWVASEELADDVQRAVSSLRNELHFEDGSEPVRIPESPVDVTIKGTQKQMEQRQLEESLNSFRRDPFDVEPRFASLREEVEKMVDAALSNHPMKDGFGFCHVQWDKKKEILREQFQIVWKTPSELNPGTIFD